MTKATQFTISSTTRDTLKTLKSEGFHVAQITCRETGKPWVISVGRAFEEKPYAYGIDLLPSDIDAQVSQFADDARRDFADWYQSNAPLTRVHGDTMPIPGRKGAPE